MSTSTQQHTTRDERIVVRPLGRPGDLGWVVMAHAEVYAGEFDWDSTFETLVARIVTDFAEHPDPAGAAAWIAELDGRRAGCIFCVRADDTTAKLRILLVDPAARGHGLGARLVDTCLAFAKEAGYQRITLWTNDILASARRIYQAVGFELVDQEPHHSFGHDLVGQNWSRDL
jgi:GNAT superfamily N-acetyltransferase